MKLRPAHLLAATALILVPVHAGVIFEENFNDVASAEGLVEWTGIKDQLDRASGAWIEVREDEADLFGEGASNRVLVLNDHSLTGQVNILTPLKGAGDVVTASLDFVEPSAEDDGSAVVRIGTGKNTDTERAANVALRGGRTDTSPKGAFPTGRKHRLTIVANNSADTVRYGAGASLASQHYDIYIDGTLLLAGIPFETKGNPLTPGTALDALRLLTYRDVTKDKTVMFDNIKVETGAQAP